MFIIFKTDTGQIEQLVRAEPAHVGELRPGTAVIEADFSDPEGYVVDGEPYSPPPRPSVWHVFDYASKKWRDIRTLTDLKERALSDLAVALQGRIDAPIEHAGHRVDADASARSSIADKLSEIETRQQVGMGMPPELLVWRDADNLLITFSDMADMKTWLQLLSVSISERTSRERAWSWDVKAEIHAALSKEALEGISLA